MWKTHLTREWAFAIVSIIPESLAQGQVSTQIPNPITAKSFECLVLSLTKAAIEIAVPLAVMAIIIAGVRFILAGVSGNDGEITKAKTMLFWIVIGAAVVVGSFVIANAAVNFIGGRTGEIQCGA